MRLVRRGVSAVQQPVQPLVTRSRANSFLGDAMRAKAGLQRVVRTVHGAKSSFQRAMWVRGNSSGVANGAPDQPRLATNHAVFAPTGLWNSGKIKAAHHGLGLVAQVHDATNVSRVMVHPTSVNPFSVKHRSAYEHREGGTLDEIRADRSSYKTLIHYGEHVITRTEGGIFHIGANSIGATVRNSSSWKEQLNKPSSQHYSTVMFGGNTTAFAHGYAQYIATKTHDKRALKEMRKYGLALSERDFAAVASRYESLLRDRQTSSQPAAGWTGGLVANPRPAIRISQANQARIIRTFAPVKVRPTRATPHI